MYRYDELDQQLVDARVEQFRDQVRRYLAGELNDADFQQLRLRNGLYRQLHAYMLRVAVPYGLLSSRQMRMLAYIARTYDRDFGHFTTRQNIQYNWPELEAVPDILKDLASVQMHAIQTSGNCVRNITSDPYAGVAADEEVDPRPYCEMLRQWSTLHPEYNWLPRKFKIAVTGASHDRTAFRFHDIGLRLVRNSAGETGFEVWVGGGLGRTPVIGKRIREFLPERHMLSYVDAILRVYNLLGRRDNKHKARIKILVNALGIESFRDKVEAQWQALRDHGLELQDHDLERMKAFFRSSSPLPAAVGTSNDERVARWMLDTRFADWYRHNTIEHKVPGYRVVVISLKAPGVPPGDISADQMDVVADLAERFSDDEIRATHEQNLVLAHVRIDDLVEVWRILDRHGLATANIGTLNDMICCPGLDFCSLANAGSIPIAKDINERFDRLDYLYDLGEIKLKMSGCMNACGHHHIGHIGILGVDKSGEEWYQITLGGSADDNAAIGKRIGPSVPKDEVSGAIEKILDVYLEQRGEDESFIDTVNRVGIQPFKERVYASHQKSAA